MYLQYRQQPTVDVSDTEQTELTYDDFHYILTGGDLLTTARARGSQRIRKCGERPKDRLEGILPVCEDWHAKMCLLGVSCFLCTLLLRIVNHLNIQNTVCYSYRYNYGMQYLYISSHNYILS